MMKLNPVYSILFMIFAHCVNENNCARILAVFPFQGKSHMVMFEPLMKELANRGHYVDVVSHFPQKTPIPRYKDLSVRGTLPIYVNRLGMDIIENLGLIGCLKFLLQQAGNDVCDALFASSTIQQLLNDKNTKYDLFITEIFGTDCMLTLADKFKIPSVGICTSVALPWIMDRFGGDDNPAYIPNYWLSFTDHMNLFERVLNTVITVFTKFFYETMSINYANNIVKQIMGPNATSISQLVNNMSLLLVNSHFSLNIPRSMAPNIIEVAGLHVKQTEGKLPQNLEQIYNETTKPIILFSMGSMIRTETFLPERQRALIEAFGELPATVIWKAEKDHLPGPFPSNIVFVEWAPQAEILSNNKTALFITHGGLMGTQEAITYGVPMVGIPFFGDQHYNIRTYEQQGIAKLLPYEQMTKENVLNVVRSVLDDPSYKERMTHFSKLFRDRPLSAMDTAIYWIEYVIRHNGAAHLKPARADLAWYQIYLCDIAAIIFILLTIILFICHYLIKIILAKLLRKKKEKKQ